MKGNGETGEVTIQMPELVRGLGPREAAALCGKLGELLFWALQAEAIFLEVATAWAEGKKHPFAMIGVVESKIALVGRQTPRRNVLAGAALPSEVVVGMRGAINKIKLGLEQTRIAWRDDPGKDVLETRIRSRILGAVIDFVAFVVAEQRLADAGTSVDLKEPLEAGFGRWLDEVGLKLDATAVDNWREFWGPQAAPAPPPTALDKLRELAVLAEDVRRMAPASRTVEDLGRGMVKRTVALGADGSLPPP